MKSNRREADSVFLLGGLHFGKRPSAAEDMVLKVCRELQMQGFAESRHKSSYKPMSMLKSTLPIDDPMFSTLWRVRTTSGQNEERVLKNNNKQLTLSSV